MKQAEHLRVEAFEQPLGGDLMLRGKVAIYSHGEEAVANPKPVVILVHGFKSFQDWGFNPYVAEELARSGYYAVQLQLSCNGVHKTDFDELDKFAQNTYSREQEDLAVLLRLLLERKLPLSDSADSSRIALLGHSRGGGNSIIFAAEHPQIKAVVTWNGIAAVNLFDAAFREEAMNNGVAYVQNARTKQQMPIGRTFFEDLDRNVERFDIVAKLAELSVPVLCIQGDEDTERLRAGFQKLHEAAPHQTFVTIHGGTHTFGAVHPFTSTTPQLEEALQATRRFLEAAIGTEGSSSD
ncbi:alpha/beta hydrolase family protein [Paenibacillus cremeus]|uniref:Alpha/beta hydrolase n=1 Tax=Paenibacillus cremeus TaxID=2163881 RepID=A0A559KIB0_9BACL|nr:alpha/beta hydrolase [Paenibacillus cremeus]TVY11856.1 alpha/beta hydrolase [Paenibacillus cremeus]